MKKLTAFLVTLLLGGMLSLAHAGMRALNPQPLPPGMKAQSKVQVNPQPLPPGGNAALNPQPLPPRVRPLESPAFAAWGKVREAISN
jgi:hypothetical protein